MRSISGPSRPVTLYLSLAVLAVAMAIAPRPSSARSRSDAPPAPMTVIPSHDPLIIVVSLRHQQLTVYDKSGAVTRSPVSSGMPEHPTPTGIFSVIGKEVDHESNIYDGAEMPYMQRLTWSGTAMHAGNLPGYAASHGCVRLPYAFSKHLFDITTLNTRVIVTHDDVTPRPISHPALFTPAAAAPTTQPMAPAPMVSAVASRVASLAGVTPALATEAPTDGDQLPLSAKAKARFAETAKRFEAIRSAEIARLAVWDRVKAANRDLEAARAAAARAQDAADASTTSIDAIRRQKKSAEADLAAVMRRAERSRGSETLETLSKAEDVAEARLIDISDKLDAEIDRQPVLTAAIAPLEAKLEEAMAARRALDDDLRAASQALKDAQTSYALAKREDARYLKPVSAFISRKTEKLYVRQGFEPVLEVPVTITDKDQPLGTHVYTAMTVKGGELQWSVMSLQTPTRGEESRRAKSGFDGRNATATKALDRIVIPQDARDAIAELVKPGSSLIVSDEGTSEHFGDGTDFTVAVH